MPKTTDSVIFSEIEREILETALQNPALSNSEIADRTGARLTLVRDTRRTYEDEVELSEAAAEAAAAADAARSPAGVNDADLSETQVAILEALQAEPTLSNAEVADRTGARMALVRDTRAEYGEAVTAAETAADASEDADTDDTIDTADEPSEAQTAILTLAADDPSLSNAEIADQTGARITLVRDTLREFDTDVITDTTVDSGTSADAGPTPDIDTDAFSDTQVDIIETALDDPELTNAEIADRTGTRITLVRDTIRMYESGGDGTDAGTETGTTGMDSDTDVDSDGEDVLAAVDTDAFSETQLDVLETALANPELTNADVADRTGTRITLVRDTLFDHEYDEKPWAGEPDESEEEADDETDSEPTTPTADEPELPETTASDLLSAAERAILETALEDPELTNAEIAAETDTRLTLVRDTRRTYEDAVDLAEPTNDADATDDADATGDTGATVASAGSESELPETTASDLLSPAERAILETALEDPELTNAEIAAETDSRITLVRDTRRTYEDAVDRADAAEDAEETAPDSTSADAEPTAADEAAEPGAAGSAESADSAEPDSGSDGGLSTGLLVVLLIGLLLAIALAASQL